MLFLLLELAALFLVVQKNDYQNAKFYNWTLSTAGSLYEKQREIRDYFYLREINEELSAENAILQELITQGSSIQQPAMLSILDPMADKNIDIIPAKVVSASVNFQHNLFTINVGSADSVGVDMAVIGPKGVVGVVKSVSRHYAMVLPIINVEYRVSSKLYQSNYFGSLQWDAKNYRIASLESIEQHVDVQVGDTIVSSGYGAIFPEGIMVGTVRAVLPGEEGVFHAISVNLSTDFRKLSYVYVLKNAYQEERVDLENLTGER